MLEKNADGQKYFSDNMNVDADLERSGLKNKVGIIRFWPEHAAAEHEVIERFRFAFSLLGVEVVEVDRQGFFLNGPSRRIGQDDVDFVISLHYETPKNFDCFSWGALWNPVDFYVEWGLNPYLDNQTSHDGYFVCGSTSVNRLMRIELGAEFDSRPQAQVNHTLSGPIILPERRSDRRIAYCGINWERLSSKEGRFDTLLKGLDRAKVLDIFGPDMFRGVRVWEGFEGYRYPVPFDGQTLIRELSASGAVLALSSSSHIRSGIMSNRLFEAAAAGTVVFVDNNPFVDRYFKEEVVQIPINGDGGLDGAFIISALNHYNNNVDEAFQKASALQAKFNSGYALHKQLEEVYATYRTWKAERERQLVVSEVQKPKVNMVLVLLEPKSMFPDGLLDDILTQSHGNITTTIVVPSSSDQGALRSLLPSGDIRVVPAPLKSGASENAVGHILAAVLDDLTGDYACVFLGHERIFKDYVLTLSQALTSDPATVAAKCGVLLRHYDPAKRAFSNEEEVSYARPGGDGGPVQTTLGGCMFRLSFLRAESGVIQMLGWTDVMRYLTNASSPRVTACDRPLIAADLKKFETFSRLDVNSVVPSKAELIMSRYMSHSASQNSNSQQYAGFGPLPTATFFSSLPESERREIIITLLKAMPLPKWFIKLNGVLIRRIIGFKKARGSVA